MSSLIAKYNKIDNVRTTPIELFIVGMESTHVAKIIVKNIFSQTLFMMSILIRIERDIHFGRLCMSCDMGLCEDEVHFILNRPFY